MLALNNLTVVCRHAAKPISIGIFLFLVGSNFSAQANVPLTNYPGPVASENSIALDDRHLFALGMIETGNDDRAVGGAGEISRYQLSPAVWHSYSSSRDYQNPHMALQVARLHWNYLAVYFREKCGRPPTDFDMYVLWNTNYGYYARKGFSKHHLDAIVHDRAQRFVNLVHRQS